jgi:hypothetical protein
MLKYILVWISNATNEGLKHYILIDVTKSTTNDLGFEQALINTSNVRGCISLATNNGFLDLANVIVLPLIQL